MNKEFIEALDLNILKNVSKENLMEHVKYLCSLQRISGTEEEYKAVDYIVSKLKEYDLDAKVYEFDALISRPLNAKIDVIHPELKTLNAITHPFSLSTPKEGIISELVYLKHGKIEDYNSMDVEGKIVLTDGNASPEKAWIAQQMGATGLVNISNEKIPHEMIITTIWGTPSIKTCHRIPKIYVASVGKSEGEYLKEILMKEKVLLKLYTKTDTKWCRLRMPIATVEGTIEKEKFVLIGGHLDSWYYGATDNATGNACCLEIARILSQEKVRLRRSVKIAWWVGHSQGRYAGSTYYVDIEWEDLNKNCIAYINVDSPGSKDTTVYLLESMPETMDFAEYLARKLTGLNVERLKPGRWGDQSFWGLGVPSIDCYSMAPEDKRANVGGSGGGWWWHTPYDTIEYVDPEFLVRDTQVNLAIVLALANSTVLPLKFSRSAELYLNIIAELKKYDRKGILNLNALENKGIKLKTLLEKIEKIYDQMNSEKVNILNSMFLQLSRILNPTLFTFKGRYEQDYAVDEPYIPGLSKIIELEKLDENNALFLITTLIRERNRVSDTLDDAIKLVEETLDKM
ncbi:MAG: M28 family peptidase [Nitrososphaeria archaeon]|nr:M28 family peptidase [Nitrososphaeria archaeon]